MQRRVLRIIVKYFFLALLAVVIIVLSIFEFRNLLLGPKIDIIEPKNYQLTEEPLLKISGNIKNAIETQINDKIIFLDPEGNFKENYILAPGINHLKFYAKDRFGKEKIEYLEVVLK
jgi:hypothetical protein